MEQIWTGTTLLNEGAKVGEIIYIPEREFYIEITKIKRNGDGSILSFEGEHLNEISFENGIDVMR